MTITNEELFQLRAAATLARERLGAVIFSPEWVRWCERLANDPSLVLAVLDRLAEAERPQASATRFFALASIVEHLALIRWRETSGDKALVARDLYATARRLADETSKVDGPMPDGSAWPDFAQMKRERDCARQGEAQALKDLANAQRARNEACAERDGLRARLRAVLEER